MKFIFGVYDIEVLRNVFICCVKLQHQNEILTYEISSRRNDLDKLCELFKAGHIIFTGYNNIFYDGPIVNYIVQNQLALSKKSYIDVTKNLKELSDSIIEGNFGNGLSRYKYPKFKQLDLMQMLASKALRVGLKSLQVTMFYPNVQEMTVDWNSDMPEHDIDKLIYYCHNDVNSTSSLLGLMKGQLKLRMDIMRKTGLTNILGKDPVGVGVEVFTQEICKRLGVDKDELEKLYRIVPELTSYRDLISPVIKFKSRIMNEVLDWYQKSTVSGEDVVITPSGFNQKGKPIVDKTIVYNKLQHTFAQGGLHSVNQPKIYIADDKIRIIDIDAESLYPSLTDVLNVGPFGFITQFAGTIRDYKQQRVVAKAIGKNKDGLYTKEQVEDAKIEDQTKKLSLNSIIGHLRNQYGPYMAPQANAAICINGQLKIAMLIEDMEGAGFECIMSNTDGITLLVPRDRYDEFAAIYKAWEKVTGLKMEETEYEKMVIFAVNDYIAYKEGYSKIKDTLTWDDPAEVVEYNFAFIKTTKNNDLVSKYIKAKGMFLYYTRLGKGLSPLIIPKALIDYFGKGTPIEETISNGKYIYDYVTFQKIGRQYDVIHNNQKIQHINRFYLSKNSPYLYKSKETYKYDKKTNSSIKVNTMESVISGFGVEIFNEYVEKPMPEYRVNYQYYINEAKKVVELLEPSQLTLF